MARMERVQVAELVRKAQAGDSEAMNQLLKTAYKNILFQCQRIMNHPQDAEDMAQEVLLQIYESLGTLREPERFISWANTIASRRCINERKRNPKDLQFLEDEEGNSVLDKLEEPDWRQIPDAALDNAETRRMVLELIDKLPKAQRETFLLRVNAEMSVKEIAELTGVSENTVKSRLHYGRRAIEKGVKDYEKQGIKLYGLSPLPFLLYFLRSAAETGGDEAAAAAAAAVLSAGKAAGAAGSAGGAAGSAVAGEAGTAAVAGGAAAASAGAAGGVAAGAGLLGGLGVKVAAAVLAGAVAVGGGAAVLLNQEQASPVQTPVQGQTAETPAAGGTETPAGSAAGGETETPADPDAPVPLASYTIRRTTVAEESLLSRGIYLATPLFDEVNGGYRQINAYFDQLHQAFNPDDNPKVSTALARYESGTDNAEYTRTCSVTYQDGDYVSVRLWEFRWPQGLVPLDARISYTFDVHTGELLELSDLYEGTDEEVAEWVADVIRGGSFGEYLTQDNYPSADDGFCLTGGSRTTEELMAEAEFSSVHTASGYTPGQAIYTWHMGDTIDDVYIPLPAWLPPEAAAGETPVAASGLPSYSVRHTDMDTEDPMVRVTVETPVFDSDSPGYQAINAYLDGVNSWLAEWEYAVLGRVAAGSDGAGGEANVCEVSFEVTEQTTERVTVRLLQKTRTAGGERSEETFYTFDVQTGALIAEG